MRGLGHIVCQKRNTIFLIALEFLAIALYGAISAMTFSAKEITFNENDMQVQCYDGTIGGGGENYLDVSYTDAKAVVTPAFQLSRGIYYIEADYARHGIVKAGLVYAIPRNGNELVEQDEIELNPDKQQIAYRVKIHDDSYIRFKLRLTGDAVDGDYIQLLHVRIIASKLSYAYQIFCMAVLLIFIDLLLWGYVRYYCKWSAEHKIVFIVLAATSFMIGLPLYRGGLSNGSDLTFHLSRLEGLYRSLQAAKVQFPVRIQSGWLDGYGYAVSVFYGDIFLYFPALLRMIGFTLEEAYKAYLIIVNVATVFLSFYAFRRMSGNDFSAVAGSVLYAGCAQRVALMYTAVLGAASGMTFYPLIAAGFYLLFTEDVESEAYKRIWILLTAGFTGILMTHMISCLMIGLYVVLLCIVMIRKVLRRNTLRELLKAVGAVVLLNLWYIVPFVQYMFTERLKINSHLTSEIAIQDYYAGLADFTQEGRSLYHLFTDHDTIGLALILVFMLYVVTLPVQGKGKKARYGRVIAIFTLFAFAVCTDLFPIVPLARRSRLLTKFFLTIQYQYRLMSIALVLGACLTAVFLSLEIFNREKLYYLIGLLCAVTMYQNFQYYGLLSYDAVYLDGIALESRTDGEIYSYKVGNGEYLPEMTQTTEFTGEIESAGQVYVERMYRNELFFDMAVRNESSEEGKIQFPVLYYGGYQAIDSDTRQKLQTVVGDNGRVEVIIPSDYDGTFQLGFYEPLIWRISEAISVITLVMVILFAYKPDIVAGILKRQRKIRSV